MSVTDITQHKSIDSHIFGKFKYENALAMSYLFPTGLHSKVHDCRMRSFTSWIGIS